MRLFHTLARTSTVFDDPNLVSSAGLVPVLALADRAGLRELADEHLTVPMDKGANAGLKVASLVAGMVAGGDSIDDMAVLRHGGMSRLFVRGYAPSTLGSFLRAFTFGHIRQLDAVASRFLLALNRLTGTTSVATPAGGEPAPYALVDVDDTVVEVHGHAKQGAGFGYNRVRGLNALLATLTIAGSSTSGPLIVAQRLRQGQCNSARGAKRLVGDATKTTGRLLGPDTPVLVRMDSAFYGRGPVHAALAGSAAVSVTVRMNAQIRTAIAAIGDDAWTTIQYTDAVFDEATGRWISRAEVAEIDFTAFAAQKKTDRVPGRLVVRRIPDFNAKAHQAAGQDTLFDVWRFHAFFTTADPALLDTVAADATHRGNRPDPPASRGHRAGPRRPEELRVGPPALRCVHRQRRLAGARGHRVQPHPHRGNPRRTRPRESDHRDPAPQADPGALPGRDIRTTHHPAPTPGLALGDRLDRSVRARQRPTQPSRGLTIRRKRHDRRAPWNTPAARPGDQPRPTTLKTRPQAADHPPSAHRWIRA
jgi:hypothetical protein